MPTQEHLRQRSPAPTFGAHEALHPAPVASNEDQQERLRRQTTDPEVIRGDHERTQEDMTTRLSGHQAKDVKAFRERYEKNQKRYETVAAATNVPAPLIAAIHWRESEGDFGTYLHQGDPLGKRAVHEPTGIPVFTEWEPAAIHALNLKASVVRALQMDSSTTDLAEMATYAEFYNGLGYRRKGEQSPYVYSGTDKYKGGKYTSDGHYSPTARDDQVGIVPLVESLDPKKQG